MTLRSTSARPPSRHVIDIRFERSFFQLDGILLRSKRYMAGLTHGQRKEQEVAQLMDKLPPSMIQLVRPCTELCFGCVPRV
jgi:hypothetical protein